MNLRDITKLKFKSSEGIFFTSDFHFMHRNICLGSTKWFNNPGEPENSKPYKPYTFDAWPSEKERINFCRENGLRNFRDEIEMTETLTTTINDMVDKNDTLFLLGDLYFGTDGSKGLRDLYNRINCNNIFVVWGNHDNGYDTKENVISRFSGVGHYAHAVIEGKRVIMSHYRFSDWDQKSRGSYHLHGHSHGNLIDLTINPIHPPRDPTWARQRCLDVGVDSIFQKTGDMRPISFKEIEEIMETIP